MKSFLNLWISIFSLTEAGYDKNAASSWAESCAFGCSECPDDSTCGCTYFTTHAMSHGGWGYGYQGVCATLWSNFKAGKYAGWAKAGTAESDIHIGDAVIMNNGHSGDASHCCIGTGHGLVSCHNPGHRDVPASSTWYSGGYINAVYTYVGTTSVLNATQRQTSICSECTDNVCSILPEDNLNIPCYQGTPEDTNRCYKTDPLIHSDTYVCNTCASQGYDKYLSNDPIFKNMELWQKSNQLSSTSSETIINCSPYEADACNCVYYARDRQPKLPTGLTTCADKKSKVNSHNPAPGCVMFRTGDPTYCHATYVTKVANGLVYYDQANWSPCKCSSDSLSTTSTAILGYWCPP
jgi:hypothetical protein